MTSLPNLHDGFFDGLWLSPDKGARLFVRTVRGERSTIVLTEVEALNISDLRGGNVILDVAVIAPEKLTVADIEQLYDLKHDQIETSRRLLSNAQLQGLSALEINPSYGAEGKVLFRSIDTISEHALT